MTTMTTIHLITHNLYKKSLETMRHLLLVQMANPFWMWNSKDLKQYGTIKSIMMKKNRATPMQTR